MGLVSAGRIDKDTPPLTTPSHTSKSSTMDISSHIFKLKSAERSLNSSVQTPAPALYDIRPKAYLYSCKMREGKYRRFLAWILT